MTTSDLERRAYIAGDTKTAGLYADLDDAERQIEGFDDERDAAYKEGVKAGKDAAYDTYSQTNLDRLESELKEARRLYRLARHALVGVAGWFDGDALKTAKGRKDCAGHLCNALSALPVGVSE